MSYRLINANALATNCKQVNDMPCIYADLPNGLDGGYYDMTERTCEIESSYLNDFTVKYMCWYEFEMKCGYKFSWDEMEPPKFCPNCGARVVA